MPSVGFTTTREGGCEDGGDGIGKSAVASGAGAVRMQDYVLAMRDCARKLGDHAVVAFRGFLADHLREARDSHRDFVFAGVGGAKPLGRSLREGIGTAWRKVVQRACGRLVDQGVVLGRSIDLHARKVDHALDVQMPGELQRIPGAVERHGHRFDRALHHVARGGLGGGVDEAAGRMRF